MESLLGMTEFSLQWGHYNPEKEWNLVAVLIPKGHRFQKKKENISPIHDNYPCPGSVRS